MSHYLAATLYMLPLLNHALFRVPICQPYYLHFSLFIHLFHLFLIPFYFILERKRNQTMESRNDLLYVHHSKHSYTPIQYTRWHIFKILVHTHSKHSYTHIQNTRRHTFKTLVGTYSKHSLTPIQNTR